MRVVEMAPVYKAMEHVLCAPLEGEVRVVAGGEVDAVDGEFSVVAVWGGRENGQAGGEGGGGRAAK